MVTLKDIAEKAGVSVITVSRALSGTYPNKVGDETRARILHIADELGYHPNIPAKALRGNRTYQFGLVVPNVDGSFIPEIVQGLQDIAMEMHYSCLLYVTNFQPTLELAIFKTLISKQVDGILWLPGPSRHKELDQILADQNVVQLLYKEVESKEAILVDQEKGAYQATRHLIQLGHRRIGNLACLDRHGIQRLAGYRRALSEAGISLSDDLVKTVSTDWEDARLATHALLSLDEPPSSIVCYSDLVAWAALRAAGENRLSVPGDLSLVGFDDASFIQYVEIPMTTVAQPKKELGNLAMKLLSDMIDGNETEDRVLVPSLIARASTAPPTQSPTSSSE